MRALPARFDKAEIIRKTALLAGVAGLFLTTAPAFAQDGTASQAREPVIAAPPAAEQPRTLTLLPGSDVKGSDGMVLGKLEGARNTEAGQELAVRGTDGLRRGVPVSGGVSQDGDGVAVGWTSTQFSTAPAIAGDVAAPAGDPSVERMPVDPSDEPATEPVAPMAPAAAATPRPGAAEPGPPAAPGN